MMSFLVEVMGVTSGDGRNRNAVLLTLNTKDYTLIQFF